MNTDQHSNCNSQVGFFLVISFYLIGYNTVTMVVWNACVFS